MKKLIRYSSCLRYTAALAMILGCNTSTWADDEALMPLQETRAASFQYFDTTTKWAGMLQSETIEPGTPDRCVKTTHVYDNGNINAVHGNKTSSATSNCSGASSTALFTARASSIAFDTYGQFPISSTNAASHTETYSSIDPRFGIAKSITGPNGLTSTVSLDELGRKVSISTPDGDGTSITTTSSTTTTAYNCNTNSDQSVDPTGGAVACGQAFYYHPAWGTAINADSFSETIRYAANGIAQGGISRTYYDSMGREIGSIQTGIDLTGQSTTYRRVLKAYDSQGRQSYTTTVHLVDSTGALQNGSTKRWSVTVFDTSGRPTDQYTPDDSGVDPSMASGQVDGVSISSIVNYKFKLVHMGYVDGQIKTYQYTSASGWGNPIEIENKNAVGQLMLKTDAYGNQIAYRYDAQGQLVGTKDGAGNTTQIDFDKRGRKTDQYDPDLGHWIYSYDALGQLKSQTDAKGQTQTMAYDVLGRLTSKFVPSTTAATGFTSTYIYDTCNTNIGEGTAASNWKGALCQETTNNGYTKYYSFDSLGRTTHTRTQIGTGGGSKTFDAYQSFDGYGRLKNTTYPTGIITTPQYSTNGVMIGLNQTGGMNKPLWTAKGLDQYGAIQQWQLGNGLITTEYRDVIGRLTAKNAGTIAAPTSIQNLQYTFNQTGDLAIRNDLIMGALDTYSHDALHRLVQWVNQNPYQIGGSYTVGYGCNQNW